MARGDQRYLGSHVTHEGTNFAIWAPSATKVELCLIDSVDGKFVETRHDLVDRNGFASVSDVADELELMRPSVSLMIKRLADLGFLERKPYRGFVLTARGKEVAVSIQRRHALLSELFGLLGLDPQRYRADIEGLEHHISDRVFDGLELLVAHLLKHPIPATNKAAT